MPSFRVRPAPNGIEFIPEYKTWKVISITHRFDNNTVRAVLGNDVAIRAISDHKINPWPDGTIMAKVVWSKKLDDEGIAHADKFQHVSLMIRDSKKYAATKNWGFAWWNGEGLVPNGKDASCHTPHAQERPCVYNSHCEVTMSKAETCNFLAVAFVFSGLAGCARQNPFTVTKSDVDAAVESNLPWQPQNSQMITTWVDPTHSTMSTLYGNDLAVRSVRTWGATYPMGAAIALVTWRQKEDERWFGANIPATVQSVEFVTVISGPANDKRYIYQRFEGGILRQTVTEDVLVPHARTAYLLSQRAATMP